MKQLPSLYKVITLLPWLYKACCDHLLPPWSASTILSLTRFPYPQLPQADLNCYLTHRCLMFSYLRPLHMLFPLPGTHSSSLCQANCSHISNLGGFSEPPGRIRGLPHKYIIVHWDCWPCLFNFKTPEGSIFVCAVDSCHKHRSWYIIVSQ